MTDTVDKATRSRIMAGIRGRNTKPEWCIRSALHAAGFRYRLYDGALPGRPDLVLPKFRAVIFVQGCFWHRHKGCHAATTPASNIEFWQRKFEQTIVRDARNMADLRTLGWRVATVWECTVRHMSNEQIATTIGKWLRSEAPIFELLD